MSSAKEKIFGCLNITFGSNLARLTWATVLHLGGIVLTIINLAITTATPKEALSWAHFDLREGATRDARWNIGLLKYQSCGTDVAPGYDAGCHFHDMGDITNPEGNLLEAGRGVITACTFAMLFALISVIIMWLWIAGKADKLKFPRIILQISNFLSLTLYIVAISTYYKLSFNTMKYLEYQMQNGTQYNTRNIMAGYAVAILIVVIVMSFFAWAFTFWRVCRPNKNEPAREKKPKASKTKDVDTEIATSTSALDTAKAQKVAEESVEGQPDEPGSYENPSSPSNGGYGGSYGGAYGNAGGAYSSNDGGAYGNSSSAYGNSGGAYSQKESAYGY